MADKINKIEEEEEIEAGEAITLTDEDGAESNFELIGEMELEGTKYLALAPLDEEAEEDIYVVLKVVQDENGEDILETVDDDKEFDKVVAAFEEIFMGEVDLDQ